MPFEFVFEDMEPSETTHTFDGELWFGNQRIWGPASCHESASTLADIINKTDPRFTLRLTKADPEEYYHKHYMTLKSGSDVLLKDVSVIDNMIDLADAIRKAQAQPRPGQ
ncbi:hypothetical protein F5144DRAFT_4164 [Chaetomium tenue]|uniref:Uncharacterized protein n=1 Tax=Chaetomium tenue TaxID=1854479 RepID=A0ACB7PKH6_9PEZI|nr:hypothetical protein F5144DRAFT_4164 [Chaetomium globosum]